MRVTSRWRRAYPIESRLSSPGFVHDAEAWETTCPRPGSPGVRRARRMIGHISIGLELVNSLWRKCRTEEMPRLDTMTPGRKIADAPAAPHGAHHGTPQWLSRQSKTGAMALNTSISTPEGDVRAGYSCEADADRITMGRPLNGNLVKHWRNSRSDAKRPPPIPKTTRKRAASIGTVSRRRRGSPPHV